MEFAQETDGGEQFQLCQDIASPDTELDENLEQKCQIEDGDKKKCLEEKNNETGESIGENVVEGVSVIYSKHIEDDDEYEKRFQIDIEKAVCQSLGSLKKHYGLLLSTDAKDETTSRLDVYLYVIVQSQWRLRQFRDEFMSRSEKKHAHAGDPCFICAYSDTYTAIRIATRDMPRRVAVPFSSEKLCPVYDFFQEWLGVENPVDEAEISDYELKQHFVAVVRKIVEDLEHQRQISNQANEQDVITETELEIFTSLSCSR